MTRRLAFLHRVFDFLPRFIREPIRSRLRCPDCKAVGTWKPHGGRSDVADSRKVRRWLCKWCGYYVGPEGVGRASLGSQSGYRWTLDYSGGDPTTPRKMLAPINPWRG